MSQAQVQSPLGVNELVFVMLPHTERMERRQRSLYHHQELMTVWEVDLQSLLR